MKIARTILPLALVLVAAGCADKKATSAPAASPVSPASLTAQGSPSASNQGSGAAGAGVETPGLHVSDEIARACNLPKQEYAPSFDYDSDAIGDQDRALLSAVARCLSEGPLKGRALELTGRADPRGEPEYNMSLGESRADSVQRYLHDLGVQQERLRATSRGELDADGTDEAGWAHDRRVDISLLN
ncbi:MAG TPA: OmpA family protein [Polyangiaceae bacterium]|jgi:peptidoglycan-associated lipoprotein